MCDSMLVQISNSSDQLFEAALFLGLLHVVLLNQAAEVSARAELHNMTPPIVLVQTEISSHNDVWVVQALANAILGVNLVFIGFL